MVDAHGRIVREAKVASEPEALVMFFHEFGALLTRIGLEAEIRITCDFHARVGLRGAVGFAFDQQITIAIGETEEREHYSTTIMQ